MGFNNNLLCKRSQTQKNIYCTNRQNCLTEIEIRKLVARSGAGVQNAVKEKTQGKGAQGNFQGSYWLHMLY